MSKSIFTFIIKGPEKAAELQWKTGVRLTHVILVVDYRVVIRRAAGVSIYRLYVVGPIVCVDGSLKLPL